MTSTLRPMNPGEILDRTFQIYRAKFWAFAGIAALPAVGLLCTNLAYSTWVRTRLIHAQPLLFRMTLAGIITNAILYHLSSFLHYLARPAFVYSTARVMRGEETSVRSAIASVRRRLKSFLCLDLIQLTLILPLPTILFIVSMVGLKKLADLNPPAGSIGFAVLLFIPIAGVLAGYVIWMGAYLALAFPAFVIEDATCFAALKRSSQLGKGSRFRVMFTWSLVNLVGWILSTAVAWSAYLVLNAFPHGWGRWHDYFPYHLIYSLLSFIVSTLIGPIYPIAVTLFYYDQRIRLEGYDIERMMEAAGLNTPATLPATHEATTPAPVEEAQA